MKVALVIALFVAAALVQVWARLSEKTRAEFVTKAKAMIAAARRAVGALHAKLFRRHTAYRNALMTPSGELNPAGRIIIAHLSKFCYAFSTTAAGESVDRDAMMRREGRRQVYLEIQRILSLDPTVALQAAREEDLLAA